MSFAPEPRDGTDLQDVSRYQRAFRALLCRVRTHDLQRAIERLMHAARSQAERCGMAIGASFDAVYARSRKRVIERLLKRRALRSASARRRWELLFEAAIPTHPFVPAPDFHCDAALGGVARWLRVAGYDAAFWPGIDDDALLQKMHQQPAILLTADRPLFERGVIRWGVIAARFVSIRLDGREQFLNIVRQLSLPIRAPRCMACGGGLVNVAKHAVRELIPPKTFAWLDEYFQCARCGRLFWQGTHWSRIATVLGEARAADRRGSD
ncbi:MAG TPA: Mut7-C RNAse domain-containing protein [Pirellulales bacterium]|nr:Mut7-C RNAse domain-containing protein [Pirellulales bacterium]